MDARNHLLPTSRPWSFKRHEKSLEEVFPYMKFTLHGECSCFEAIKILPKPRFIKTHLSSSYLERQLDNRSTCPRFVVVMRSPKDVLTSYYHFHKSWLGDFVFPNDWNYFFGMFKEKRLGNGDCFDHMLGWWNYRNHPASWSSNMKTCRRTRRDISRKSGSFWGHQIILITIWNRL